MEHCTQCGGGIDRAKVEHVVKNKEIYHSECYRVKRYWDEQERQQAEMIEKARKNGL